MEQVGEEQIDASTAERRERKAREKEEEDQKRKAESDARDLEQLFDKKIKVLEIEEIKNTKNRTLKAKLRRSKNEVELQLYAQLILMEELGIGFTFNESE
jgi:type II secretory pathway component PulF